MNCAAEEFLHLSCEFCTVYSNLPRQHCYHWPSQKHFDQSIIRLLNCDHHHKARVQLKLLCTL